MNIKIIKRKFHLIILFSLIYIFIGIIGISAIMFYGINMEVPEAKLFNKESKTDEYVYMNVLYLESIGNKGSKYYYSAKLGDNKYAVVSISDELFNEISNKILSNGFYKLEGYLKKMDNSLKKAVIKYYDDNHNIINEDNLTDYININYLDKDYQPHYHLYVTGIVIIVITILLALIIFFNKFFCLIRYYHQKKMYDELEEELNDKSVKILKKQGFCLTKNYLFTGKSYHIYPYNDIYWIYNVERFQRNKLIAYNLVIGLSNGKEKVIWTFDKKKKDELLKITNLIYSKNKKMLYKYSEENERKYHDMINKV